VPAMVLPAVLVVVAIVQGDWGVVALAALFIAFLVWQERRARAQHQARVAAGQATGFARWPLYGRVGRSTFATIWGLAFGTLVFAIGYAIDPEDGRGAVLTAAIAAVVMIVLILRRDPPQ
jgi:hypothetical protein